MGIVVGMVVVVVVVVVVIVVIAEQRSLILTICHKSIRGHHKRMEMKMEMEMEMNSVCNNYLYHDI